MRIAFNHPAAMSSAIGAGQHGSHASNREGHAVIGGILGFTMSLPIKSIAVAAMALTLGMSTFGPHARVGVDATTARADATTASESYASRDYDRLPLRSGGAVSTDGGDGQWALGSPATTDVGSLFNRTPPVGFDPNHPTGDAGNVYEFSQCTWWAYVRRHQLGLPAGSHMGNGADWANTARSLGYWVDSEPMRGDVMVFAAGQDGADPSYGHVAIVESVAPDGSITTSNSGSVMNGRTYTQTFTAAQAARHQFIHR